MVWLRTTLPYLGQADIQQRLFNFQSYCRQPYVFTHFFSTLAPLPTLQIFCGLADGLPGAAPEMLGACAV
jgi:hypothetical protein